MPETRIAEARQAGHDLARLHTSARGGDAPRRVRNRVRVLDRRFQALYKTLRAGPVGSHLLPRSEDWLLQNDHVVGEGLDRLAEALSPAFCRRLAQIHHPESGAPILRVEALTRDRVREAEGRLDLTEIMEFLRGYQEVHLLTLAELWAFPSFLRLSLLEWLDEELAAALRGDGDPLEVQDGGARVGGGIVSLRALAAEDWRTFVEELSTVEAILRQDPAGVHPRLDFRTRDRNRHEVEEVARRSRRDEEEVARAALSLAEGAPPGTRRHHVGHYLLGEGRGELFQALNTPIPATGTPSRRRRWAGAAYFGGMAATTLLLLGALWAWLPAGATGVLLLLLAVLPALGVSVSLLNWGVSRMLPARPLPRMDFREGIPTEFRTVVAVPMLLTTPEEVEGVVHTMEVNYQANSDPALTYALLSDFTDAGEERVPGDETLLEVARNEVARLNRLYGDDGPGPFLLLHRGRRFNPQEGRWMGRERKRGKLHDLNALLLGHPSDLWVAEGDGSRLKDVPFVLTLDADTRLPRGAAARLVGTLAHPLNRPRFDARGRIESGYSVLQPRLEILPEAGGGSPFLRIFGGVQGLDLYAHAAFDIYQDLFDEGIFAGKGIYDVAAFEASLSGRVPDNAILSHDLFEGSHGRAGLVSDVILLEDFPEHLLVHARRAHRWVRGDWQLLPWIFSRVPLADGTQGPSAFSLLSRWKILDNLRRSLQPPLLLLFLLGAWLLLPAGAPLATLLVLGVMGLPVFFFLTSAFIRALGNWPSLNDLRAEGRALLRALSRTLLELAFLPFETRVLLDAVVRTLDRVFRSRRRLLEWTSAAVTARQMGGRNSLQGLIRAMWVAPALGVGTTLLLILQGKGPLLTSGGWGLVTAVLLLWVLAPVFAWLVNRTPRIEVMPEGRFPHSEARLVARRTWGFFERFQGPENHWLPPDNFQEDPNGEVAARTSPTNIGLALVSAVVSWDLGFVDSTRLVTRIRNTAMGMEGLPRYRGHFLNWYQIHRQEALSPVYVSTVDSGNLAASLLVTREALRDVRVTGLRPGLRGQGLQDTIRVLAEVVQEGDRDGTGEALQREAEALVRWGEARLVLWGVDWRGGSPEDLHTWSRTLAELQFQRIPALEARILSFTETAAGTEAQIADSVLHWLGHLRRDVAQARDEVALFAPWTRRRMDGSAGREREEEWRLLEELVRTEVGLHPTLAELPLWLERLGRELRRSIGGDPAPEILTALGEATATAQVLLDDLVRLDRKLDVWFREMDFSFLYDRTRRLFRIGYSVTDGELDRNHYDLLASEARIASAMAVVKGDVPLSHWLHLGRPFASAGGGPVLLSWAGTMFEYLMPTLFLRTPPETLLHDALRRAVQVQRRFGEERKVPWGISESAYHVLDHQGHYQYRAFGVPRLGLRRDGGDRLVVAPYASLMAVAWAPGPVRSNLRELNELGGMGPWGPYEAVDFGEGKGGAPRVVRCYMSHHHGMIMGALGNYLTGDALVNRLHRDPRVATIEPFLHERIPWRRPVERPWVGRDRSIPDGREEAGFAPWQPSPDRRPPPIHILSNGTYSAFLGPRGEGGSRWRDWSVIRGGPGTGSPEGGPRLVLMDRDTGESWIPLPHPGAPEGETQGITFLPHRAEYVRRDQGIRTRVGVTVAPREDVEMREIRLVNEVDRPRRLRLALMLEVALAPPEDDLRHPAFHKLFVRARGAPEIQGLVFVRRPRSPEEAPPCLAVSLVTPSGLAATPRWETDRMRFLGRNGAPDRPQALSDPPRGSGPAQAYHPLDPMVGAVLDLELEPYQELDLTLLLAVAETEAKALRMVMDLAPESRRRWLGLQARSRAEGELLALNVSTGEMKGWEELLAHLLHPRATCRARVSLDSRLDLGMPALWRWGISGDHPIVLVGTRGDEETELMSSVVRAQAYWRTRGIPVDVVVRDEAQGGYQDPVKNQIRTLLEGTGQEVHFGGAGGVHILSGSEITEEDRALLEVLAAVHLDPERGGLKENLNQLRPVDPPPPPFLLPPTRSASEKEEGLPILLSPPEGLESPSAYGGFDPKDGEYVIHLPPSTRTPSPWVNVVAREDMGFLVSESGGGFTWSQDAGEYRLSPWSNDPVQDAPGEVVYLRDEDTGSVWTPAPRPLGRPVARRMRHGWGWSFLETGGNGLGEEMEWFLHPELPVKVTRVRLRNRGDRPRRITVTFYLEWVLGTHLARTSPRLLAEYREDLGAVVARNRYVPRFSERWAFLSTDGDPDGVGVDREEFLGLGGVRSQVPPGLRRSRPGERSRPDGPACGVLQRTVYLEPGETREVDFFLGDAGSREEMEERVTRLRGGGGTGPADEAGFGLGGSKRLARNPEEWTRWLQTLQVETPDPALNRMVNGWLPYQTLSSRIRGRTGFYQSGGAFGFRDQLQDVFTLLPLDPSLAPRQLEEAARHQFEEGDVLHWWHPGTNRGVRTRCSDDLLWLPFVLAGTVQWTGDMELLERKVPYLTADPLPEGVHERYDEFPVSEREGTLWEHGLRAVERACSLRGERGLPLIGTMDWNDGMDRVGWEGRGESVWLAWFLIRILTDWVELARRRGDPDLAHRLEREREEFRAAVERHGWDGEWYRRAFFDDGSPLGSTQAPEARIDSIAQSWSVISGGADPARARQALESAWRHLVRPEDGLSLLLTPPFDGAGNHPGYIAAYPPGVRENGGQYTHAAAWLIRAVAQLGDGARAGKLLELILPPHHARNAEETRKYRVEPYVVAADIYGAPPHVGRGGWTWYTGSAGWIYRVVVEDILGLQRRGAVVRVDPCIPPDWPEFRVSWAVGGGLLEIHVTNPDGVARGVAACQVDGEEIGHDRIPVPSEGTTRVEIRLGNGGGAPSSQAADTPFETPSELASEPPRDPGIPTEARRGAEEGGG